MYVWGVPRLHWTKWAPFRRPLPILCLWASAHIIFFKPWLWRSETLANKSCLTVSFSLSAWFRTRLKACRDWCYCSPWWQGPPGATSHYILATIPLRILSCNRHLFDLRLCEKIQIKIDIGLHIRGYRENHAIDSLDNDASLVDFDDMYCHSRNAQNWMWVNSEIRFP